MNSEYRRSKASGPLVKILVALTVVAVIAFLFVRSAQNARESPYSVNAAHLRNWTLASENAPLPAAPVLVLRAAQELGPSLFRQVFARGMESLTAPAIGTIPLLLRSEFDSAFAGRMTVGALLATARAAGLESATFTPRCLAHRRVSDPGVTRQLYFLLFDAPACDRFRQQIATLPEAAEGTFDATALSPIMFVGASEDSLNRWLPLRADPDADCVAPIVTASLELKSSPGAGPK
jgi:hypothetical protein